MKKLSSYIFEHKWSYLMAVVSMIISIALDMLSPQLTKHIIDDVIVGGKIGRLNLLLGGLVVIGIGRCIFQYLKEFTFDRIGSQIGSDMRKDLFFYIQTLSADFFDRSNTGELMARVKDDIDRIWDGVSYVGMLLIEVAVHTIIVLYCMFNLNAKLTVVPMVAMLFCGYIAILMERKLNGVYEEMSEENAKLNTVSEENLSGVRTVKAFAREKYEIKKFLSHNKGYYDVNMKQSKVFIKYYPIFQMVSKILPMFVLLYGGKLVIDDQMSIGALGAYVQYSTNIVWPMEMLGWLTNMFSSAVASNRKIKKIYAEVPTIKNPEEPVILDKVKGKIEFSHVSFKKGDQNKILSDISFCVQPGKTIGIMGATGAGKTSIVQLLERFYDVSSGEIKIDGVNIKDMTLKQLRENISVVMQDVFLFSDTINENIRLGKKNELDEKSIVHASQCAQASEFIERMDDKYDTVIGERGIGLSGGQKQRISIARAISKKEPILVLDDSTSALDMETEHEIQKTLRSLQGMTKVIIAHRISAVRNADEIIILDHGEIAERGTHEQLLEHQGLYYKTYEAQYGARLRKEA
ncbi:lipid A export ATP-binding/permease protein MsbA [Lachnospiraceae bacterium KM106-2]|nr:lipid A export ATP-binding/permease protein MsbA [Lachnospiraceae bacterium KM106-2]